jgi:thymidylate synthase (FAD)
MTTNQIKVGSGSVALVDVMGSPLSVVNAARVSMGKRADEMAEKDWKLVKYLWDHHLLEA